MSIKRILRPGALLLLLLPLAALAAPRVDLRVTGLSGEPLQNVRAALSLERRRQRPGLTAAAIRELHALAPAEIARALEPFGYYRPRIEAQLTAPRRDGGVWRVRYRVAAGERVPVTQLRIAFDGAGATDPQLSQLAATLPLQQAQGLDHRRYEQARRELMQGVQNAGYRDASLTEHRVAVDLRDYTAQVTLRVATGARYVIGAIDFEHSRFRAEYLARYLLLRPGDPYNSGALAAQRRALSASGHFRRVEILPLPAPADAPHTVPLRIHLETFPANRYRGRLGWGTDTGAGVMLDWNRRYVGGRGQHFNAGVALVDERRKLAGDLNYVMPLDPLTHSSITLGARHESKDLTYSDVELDEGGKTRIATNLLSASWQRPKLAWGGFEVTPRAGLSLVEENYDVFEVLFGNLPASAQQVIIDFIGAAAHDTLTPDFEAVVPNLRLNLRRSDAALFIHRGDSVELSLLGAARSLGSNISFWQASLKTWHIRPAGERGRLLLRSDLGYSDARSREVLGVNFNAMPEYYEFRAGGVRSVRGYSFETLFPDDAITGGKHQLVGSIEYEHEIIPQWSAAAFVDAGNAFNHWDDYNAKIGVGIGLRWRSPVGLARLDLGVPLDDADDAFQIYITVGPEF
ncbi:MAG: BamA/TamA family outer membrane protein [Halioglobus sp.]|nr:BamA/TamA family outer membrane protein [Halioglobus sp.]